MQTRQVRPSAAEYRLVILVPFTGRVVVDASHTPFRLPRILVSESALAAEVIPEDIRKIWSVQTVPIDFMTTGRDYHLAIMELRSPERSFNGHGLAAVLLDEIGECELGEEVRVRVKAITLGDTSGRSPFSRLGWVDDVQAWIRASEESSMEFDDNVRSFSPISTFTLARLATCDGRAYWLKSPRSQNQTELAVTQTLARYCTAFLPRLVAVRQDWNAWITEEVGVPIQRCRNAAAYEKAVHCLAGIQISSIDLIRELVESGCFDQRIPVLRSSLLSAETYLLGALNLTSRGERSSVEKGALRKAVAVVDDACLALAKIGLRDALIHNDLNTGNILVDDERAVLIDWAEACIGVPFVSFLHLCAQAEECGVLSHESQKLTAIYKGYWRQYLPEEKLDLALALVPPVAIASYLTGRDPLFEAWQRRIPAVQEFAGKLARRLIRATQAAGFRQALAKPIP